MIFRDDDEGEVSKTTIETMEKTASTTCAISAEKTMRTSMNKQPAAEKIAIVGMGCRFPGGANDYSLFWHNILAGKDCLIETPSSRYNAKHLYSKDKAKAGRLTGGRGGYIDGFDEFDPAFFGIGPREAECMDPQQRKLLEVAFEALEDGGQMPSKLAGTNVGVFIGAFTLDYKIVQFADLSFNGISAHTATGTMMTMVSNRLSYCFDFNGPSMSIDTACSSSLVAVHLACQSLRRQESSLALAGGVLLQMTPQYTVAESKGGFLSHDGRSRTFDVAANGYVRSEGVGIVVLKRFEDALRDRDRIHAVIIGTGVNQDGRTVGITAPSKDAQVRLIRKVCQEALIKPSDLQYIEAHGTSTPVGDPIEARALGMVLGQGKKPDQKCFIGSVKTNIGHTESAAGVAGLIKTIESIKHKTIPPHINLETISPEIDIESQPYQIPTIPTPWPAHEGPARAGVNSFGFGGTNAHVLLEEAPLTNDALRTIKKTHRVFTLTAQDRRDFAPMLKGMQERLADVDEEELYDIAYTLACRRDVLEHRLSFVYDNKESLQKALLAYEKQENHPSIISLEKSQDPRLMFVMTGMGPQWWGMGRKLFNEEKVYRDIIIACHDEIKKLADWSLIDELNAEEAQSNMTQTWLAQPANFALQIALAALWRSYGVIPSAIVGHSTGEAAAFYEAGVYSLADAIKVIIHRSRLQQKLIGTGTMLAISLSESEAQKRIDMFQDQVAIAAINSKTAITLSGNKEALTQIANELISENIFAKFLTVGVPYHSPYMDEIKDELMASLADIKANEAKLPLYLTGRLGMAVGSELDASYWWDNVRQTVLFNAAMETCIKDGFRNFLEVGPHPVLSHSIKECLMSQAVEGHVLPSIRRQEDETERLMMSLASLNNLLGNVSFHEIFKDGLVVSLPTYPWKKDRYWVEAKTVAQIRLGEVDHPLLGRRLISPEPMWEVLLDVEKEPFLQDHKIQGNVLFPAAGFIEMASQAMKSLTKDDAVGLLNIEFKKALFLTETDSKPVQILLNNERGQFTIATVSSDHEPVIHATGFLRSGQSKKLFACLDVRNIENQTSLHLMGEECYEHLTAMGYHYGPAFRSISEAFIGEKGAHVKIEPNPIIAADKTSYHCHPSIMDACFQAFLACELPGFINGDEQTMRLPLSVLNINTLAIGCQAIWVHALVKGRTKDELIGDIYIFDEEGRPLGEILGFRAAAIEKISSKLNLSTIDNWLFDVSWQNADILNVKEEVEKDSFAESFLIFADEDSLALEITSQLDGLKRPWFLVKSGDDFSFDAKNKIARVKPSESTHFDELFKALHETQSKPFTTALYLWSLNHPAFNTMNLDDLSATNTYGPYPLVALAQNLAFHDYRARLMVITKNAQSTRRDDETDPLAATFWGIGRVLWHQELINHKGKLIDFDNHTAKENAQLAERIIAEASTWDEDEIAYRNDQRLKSRLTPVTNFKRPLPLRLNSDGCYVVTGAMGALGRLLCLTLAKRGARRLILMGRSAMPPKDQWLSFDENSVMKTRIKFLQELYSLGTEAIFAQVDVTNEKEMCSWFSNYKQQNLPPIRGVFHLAGMVKDALLKDMNKEMFDMAYKPKVMGAFLLHRLFAHEPLDHFVMFASIASILTTAGQTNYAAGNAFLDGLAHLRRSSGLCALSIDWGPWATGMIEELGLIEHYKKRRGMISLAPNAGMDVLERVIGQDAAQVLVATIEDWPLFLSWYEKAPLLVSDIQAEKESFDQDDESFIDLMRQASEEEGRKLVAKHFFQIVADVMRVKSEDIKHENTLNELGLDSLLAIELRARIQRDIKVALPVVTLLSQATIADLMTKLYDQLMTEIAVNQAEIHHADVEIFTDPKEFPLTKNQSALWFLKHLDPDGFAYNIGGAVTIRAAIDPITMFEAVRLMIRRHDSLRANFMQKDGHPVQCIRDEIKEDIAFINAEGLSFDEVYQMIIKEYRKPYDLEHDSLMRFRLYRLGPENFVMMKAVHHIISDAISTFTFIEELLAVYEAMRTNKSYELARVKARYLDFLNWQNKFLASPAAVRMQNYWLNHLPKEIPVLNLLTDKPRPAVQTHNGSSEFFVLDYELSQKIHALAKEKGMTVFMVLLSAYYVLLHRYSNQDHIVVGSPVMGRTEQEFSSIYGYFVNPLPLYADLSKKPSTYQLLEQVQQIVLNGLDNQEYPFVLLVDKLGLRHDPSRSAVFQAMFILLVHRVATSQYGYRLEYIELPEEEGQFDLTLSAYEDEAEGQFHCVLKYNRDLFLADTVKRLASHYVNLLQAMVNNPHIAISELDMLGHEEKQRLLRDFSGINHTVLVNDTILSLIEAHSEKTPDAIAVSCPLENGEVLHMTYGEMMKRASQIAYELHKRGLGKGDVIAISMKKSLDLIACIVGIMKVNATYLLLDPYHPVDRLHYMVQHAKAKLCFSDEDLKDLGVSCLTMAQINQVDTTKIDQAVFTKPGLNDVAYIVYTSGSTGFPKGVLITHGNLAAIYQGWVEEYQLLHDVGVHAQLANVAFDVFSGDFARALGSGGRLVLIGREMLFNTALLYEILIEQQVDCAEFVPAVLRGLMRFCLDQEKNLQFMKLMIVGSDSWTIDELIKLKSLCHPNHRVVNSYGLSETTIDTTYFDGSIDEMEPSSMVPIGKPFKNSAIYLLDAGQKPVPILVPGEIYVGGQGVARGYLGDPALSSQRFINVELDGKIERLYRTGDLAFFDASGVLRLLGRADNQIKIRGHRIEVGEIEARIKAIENVADTVITLRQDHEHDKQLCAYVVPKMGHSLDEKSLQKMLASTLPTYMMPSWFVVIDALPLSSNGKVDLSMLPKPEAKPIELEPPVTFYEIKMAEHWRRLLNVEVISLHHDFFAIGGNSIKLIELIYNLQKEFNITIAVSQLFKITTLYGMAKTIENIIIGREEGQKPYLEFNAGRSARLFCFPPAGGHGLIYRGMAEHMPEHTLVSFNYVKGDDKIERYADLIENLQPEGSCVLFGYSLGGNLAFEVAKVLGMRGRHVEKVVIMDSFRIVEHFEFEEQHLKEFEKELSEHLYRHTGSNVVAKETLEQARDYIRFCSKVRNLGSVEAHISVIAEEAKLAAFEKGEQGSWHGSAKNIDVVKGFGNHADMLDAAHVARNAELTLKLLKGEQNNWQC